MKIKRIFAHRVELPLHETTYKWSGGKSVTVFDSTIVGVETDTGLVGYGEVCPLGPFYLPRISGNSEMIRSTSYCLSSSARNLASGKSISNCESRTHSPQPFGRIQY